MADLVDSGQSGQSPGTMAVLEAMLRARGLLPAVPRVGIPGVSGVMLPPRQPPWQMTPGSGARG